MRRKSPIRSGPVTLGILLWLAGEAGVFIVVVDRVGLAGAVLLGLATTIIGLAMLRRLGVRAFRSLRRALEGAQPAPGAMLDGSLAALGSVLLILPGFLSDLVGLALAAPSVRQWLVHRFGAVALPGRPPARPSPGVIDLGPSDWRRVEGVESWSERPRQPEGRRANG